MLHTHLFCCLTMVQELVEVLGLFSLRIHPLLRQLLHRITSIRPLCPLAWRMQGLLHPRPPATRIPLRSQWSRAPRIALILRPLPPAWVMQGRVSSHPLRARPWLGWSSLRRRFSPRLPLGRLRLHRPCLRTRLAPPVRRRPHLLPRLMAVRQCRGHHLL